MKDLDIAEIEKIVRHVAATEVFPRFKNLAEGEIREKNPGDFVTVADEASEKLFGELLPAALPNSIVVGEEAVSKDKSVLEKIRSHDTVWIVDPIDGTYNFSHGRSMFGILLSLVHKGEIVAGWSYDVPGNRMITAQSGAGAFMDGKKLAVGGRKTRLSEMTLQGGGAQAWHFDPVRPLFHEVLNVRTSLFDFMAFADGTSDAVLHMGSITPWDHAVNVLISREVGGHVMVRDGNENYDPGYLGAGPLIAAQTKDACEEIRKSIVPMVNKKKSA